MPLLLHPQAPPLIQLGAELVYTLIVVILFFLVYYKTREIYDLTRHQGIKYFRYAFLFFGLAYTARFFTYLVGLSILASDFLMPKRVLFPVMMGPAGYLSTIAIFYLVYSTSWKKLKYPHFLVLAHSVAIIITITAFVTRSPMLVSLVQFAFIITALVLSWRNGKMHTRTLYFLIALFWLINLFALGPRRFLPPEIKIILQLLSLAVFGFLLYKVSIWTK